MCDFSSTAVMVGPRWRLAPACLRPFAIVGYHRRVAEESAQPLSEQLEEIRTQLAWVRDYL
jgi:hypothetical protein